MLNISDYARSVSVLIEFAGNPEARLDEINKKIDNLAGKQITAGGQQAVSQMSALAGSTDRVSNSFSSFSSRMQTAFSGMRSSLTELQGSIQNMATSLAGITIGGAVSGLAWLDRAKANLRNEQIKNAINANTQLGISYDMLSAKAQESVDIGEDTKTNTISELYAVATLGKKFVGKGEKGLEKADYITDFYFSKQESMEAQGISNPEEMVRRAISTPGKMNKQFGDKFALAMGISPDDASMKTAKSRMKLFMEEGSVVNMQFEIDKRPWIRAEASIKKLKDAIGDSIAKPMAFVTTLFADFVSLIVKIPGGSALIGYTGMFLALASTASLLIGVMTPLYGVMKAINIATGTSATLKWILTGANAAQATSQELLNISMGQNIVMEEMQIGVQNTSIASRLRLIAVTGYDTVVRWANTAANFLGIKSLIGLTAASGTATTGFTLLGVATNFAALPLWAIIGAGLVLVGVLTAIAYRAGILSPLLKGIANIDFGKVFGKVFTLDFKGAWGDIKKAFSDIEFPSIREAFTNMFGGTSFAVILNKSLGIPMSSMMRWLEKIHDAIKIVTIFFSDLWNLINKGLNWIRDGLGITRSIAEKKMKDKATEMGVSWTDKGNITEDDPYWYQGPGFYSKDNKKLSDEEAGPLLDLQKKYNEAPKGFFEGIPGITDLTDAIYKLIDSFKLGKTVVASPGNWANNNARSLASESDQSFDTDKSIAAATDTTSFDIGMGALGSMASGGFVKKSGLAIVHSGEPVIPAEIASSSRLQEILGSIASGKGNSGQQPIQINMTYSSPSNGNGIYLDKFSFERAVNDIIGKALRHYGSY